MQRTERPWWAKAKERVAVFQSKLQHLPHIPFLGYSRSKIREVAVKNTTIFVGTIIYQLHVSAVIGHLQVGIQRQRKNIYHKYRYGGTRSRLQIYGACGRTGVRASMCVHQLGSRGWVLKHWWPGVTMVGWSSRVPLWSSDPFLRWKLRWASGLVVKCG